VYVVTTHHLKILLLLHAQAFINFGPVVYIKNTGPNPIMVQVITVQAINIRVFVSIFVA
jgi:hypothetical protein